MPTIRDVVEALGSREGVDAVIVLGLDGLPIATQAADGLDTEGLAALVPNIVASCNKLGGAAGKGGFTTSVVEYSQGLVLVAEMTSDALLAIFLRPGTNVGGLLYELRRHRTAIAQLL